VLSFPVNRPIIDTTRPFRGEINLSANDGILSRYETLYSSYHCDKQQSHNPNYKQYIIQTFVYPLFEKPSSEDAVLVNFYNNDMCIVVADGVSQSAFGGIAAEYVCKYIHFEWIMALQYDEFIPTHTQLHNKTEQLIREALYQAMYHVNKSVVQAIQKSSGYKQPVLNELFDTVGSQATFACVFTHANNLICVWMGNTRIILMKSATRSIIAADDIRFDSDQERFSSHPSTLNHSGGMFGNPQIQIIPLHDIESLHVIIMSDGFENNKNGMIESLFAQQPNQSTIHATNASFSDDSSLVYVKLPTKRDHT
jgi:hypothetical protein